MSRPVPGQRSVGSVAAEAASDVFGIDGTLYPGAVAGAFLVLYAASLAVYLG